MYLCFTFFNLKEIQKNQLAANKQVKTERSLWGPVLLENFQGKIIIKNKNVKFDWFFFLWLFLRNFKNLCWMLFSCEVAVMVYQILFVW